MTIETAVKEITDREFEELMKSDTPVFVDFWAPWCGPCRIVGPMIEDLAPAYEGKIVVTKMNVDENPLTPQKFGVSAIPTMIIFKGGQAADRAIGALPRQQLQAFLDRNS